MGVVIVSAAVIGVIAVNMVSQQGKVRELRLIRQYEDRIAALRDQTEQKIRQTLEQTFDRVQANRFLQGSPDALLEEMKKIVLQNPIVQYPFVLELKDEPAFLFPFSRKTSTSGTAIPDKASLDPSIRDTYRRGNLLEAQNRQYQSAIVLYQKAARETSRPASKLYIQNAIARCYFKSNRFSQALWYYHHILDQPGIRTPAEQELYFLTLRQAALSYKLLRLDSQALKYYLQLYEAVIGSRRIKHAGIAELFKNEALDYLNQYAGQNNEERERFSRAKASDSLTQASHLDIALSWMFFELDPPSQSTRPELSANRSEELESFKLRELYTTNDEKAQFYKTVKQSPFWSGKPLNATFIDSVAEKGTGASFDLAYRKLSRDLAFGFHPSVAYVGERLFRDIADRIVTEPRLQARMVKTGTILKTTRDSHPSRLLAIPFTNFFTRYEIVLQSDRRDYFGSQAQKEILASYILIALLIIVMTGGAAIFYKYIGREEELLRLKSEFVDSVSHTLKTPLARMGLLAENIQQGWVKDETQKEQFLETIMAETARMNDTIDNMLNFSRIESGKKQYEFSETKLQNIVDDFVRQYSRHATDAGFSLEHRIDPELPPIPLDPDAIKLVLVNLLQNAIKYSGGEKYIKISLYRENDEAVLAIEDRGLGIAPKDLRRIFDKFYRAGDSRVKAREGSGLGLFLVRHAVAAHNGRITVLSEPGKGSTFLVYFPLGKR